MIDQDKRKVGINVSVPFKYIELINKKAGNNRSSYIWNLIKKDLNID